MLACCSSDASTPTGPVSARALRRGAVEADTRRQRRETALAGVPSMSASAVAASSRTMAACFMRPRRSATNFLANLHAVYVSMHFHTSSYLRARRELCFPPLRVASKQICSRWLLA
eukprot:scaffold8081_cov65-Phaeocystis_antarctica.AAC.13